MLSKEEIESMKIDLWNIRADTLKAMQCSLADTSDKKEWQKEINTIDNALKYIDQLESDKQKLIEINNKYLQKLVYALTPTKHALGDDYNNAFKKIIAENIDLETCKIKRKLKECWGIDKKF